MPQMDGLTRDELAVRAGTTAERIARLDELGITAPQPDGSYLPANAQRARFADVLERSGVDLDAVGRAVSEGGMSFAFLDLLFDDRGSYTGSTYAEAAAQHGMTVEMVQRVHEALGLPIPEAEDPVRGDDLRVFPAAQMAAGLGMGEADIARTLRVYSENLNRITQAESGFFHTYTEGPLLRSGMSQAQILEVGSQMSPQLRATVVDFILWLYRRHQERSIMEHVVEHLEQALEEAGLTLPKPERPAAMVFLDLVGYTRLTEEQGDEAAAELVATLAALVQRESLRHGGRPVKWLGDGVMFHFPDPGRAVRCSLELAGRTPAEGLPPAHVGVNAGPVIFRDGDYFGRTVNIAARIAAKAGPSEVVVSEAVVEACADVGLRFEPIGPAELKGVPRPVALYRAGVAGA